MRKLEAKDPDVDAAYAINWRDDLVGLAEREFDFGLGEIVRYEPDTGWLYVCTQAGRTGSHWPERLSRADGESHKDGSCVFTCRHPLSVSLPKIVDATWIVPPGIELAAQSIDGMFTRIVVRGGTHGVDYDLTCRMIPSFGYPLEQTITIPVLSQ